VPGRSVHYVHLGDAQLDIGPHVFPIEKYALLARWLREELAVPPERIHAPEVLTWSDLARVHGADYLDDLRHARATPATLMSELPVERAVIDGFVAMAGGTLTAARLALAHGIGFHVGGGFHHAFADHAEGFCYVNDVAVAIARLRAEGRLGRVALVDVDVHQGNGNAAILAGDADTFTYSIHQEENYPLKEKSDLDRGLADGVGDEEYLRLLAEDLATLEARFEPEVVFYLAGVDPYRHDQLGGLALTRAGLERRDELVLERFVRRGVPVAIVLAGGYARTPEETALLHLGTARAAEATARRLALD
jgi:acetoin utilization deacetylase AcuC-like enzyme